VVETNSYGLYKNFQFEYCRGLPLPRFVLTSELFSLLRNGSERNSELFSLPLKGSEGNFESLLLFLFRGTEFRVVSLPLKCSEGNSESLLLFLFRGTEFRDVFSSAEGFGTEFREILFRGTAGIPS
jgi:hypothetical protein